MILSIVVILVLAAHDIFVKQPREKELKLIKENERLMEEKERLLDRDMLRTMFANHQNEDRMLEHQLIKKIYVKVQSSDSDYDLQMKPIAEKILKVIGKWTQS